MGNGTVDTGTGPGTAGPITIPQAAELLGISDRAVRKRIAAGMLYGEQVKGQWLVYPNAVPSSHQGRNSEQGRLPEEQRNFTDGTAVGIDVATQFAFALQQVQAALIAKIGELERELGREQLRREQAEQQLAELQSQLNTSHVEPSEPARPAPVPAPGPQVPTSPSSHQGRPLPLVTRILRYVLNGRP